MRLRYAWNWRAQAIFAAKCLLAWLALMLAFLAVNAVTHPAHGPDQRPQLTGR